MNGYKPLSVATQEHSSNKDIFGKYIVLWIGFQFKIFRQRVRHPKHYTKSAHKKIMVLLV